MSSCFTPIRCLLRCSRASSKRVEGASACSTPAASTPTTQRPLLGIAYRITHPVTPRKASRASLPPLSSRASQRRSKASRRVIGASVAEDRYYVHGALPFCKNFPIDANECACFQKLHRSERKSTPVACILNRLLCVSHCMLAIFVIITMYI